MRAENAHAERGVRRVGVQVQPAALPGLASDLGAVLPSALPADGD